MLQTCTSASLRVLLTTCRTILSSLSGMYGSPPRRSDHCASLHPLYLQSTAPRFSQTSPTHSFFIQQIGSTETLSRCSHVPLHKNIANQEKYNRNASDVICPQAYPKWLTTGAVTPFTPADIPPVDPRTSEDCLFLDVLLPREIWDSRQRRRAPVLVWINGGGFTLGAKDESGSGYGLVTRSQRFGTQGVILVSINYRLGLFVSPAVRPRVMKRERSMNSS